MHRKWKSSSVKAVIEPGKEEMELYPVSGNQKGSGARTQKHSHACQFQNNNRNITP